MLFTVMVAFYYLFLVFLVFLLFLSLKPANKPKKNNKQITETWEKDIVSQGAIKILVQKLNQFENPETLKLVSLAILNLLDSEEALSQFLELKCLEKILELAKSPNEEIRNLSIRALEMLSEDGLLTFFFLLISFYFFVFCLVNSFSLFFSLLIDRLKRQLFEHDCVQFLLNYVPSNSPVEQRRKAAKSIAHILTNGFSLNI